MDTTLITRSHTNRELAMITRVGLTQEESELSSGPYTGKGRSVGKIGVVVGVHLGIGCAESNSQSPHIHPIVLNAAFGRSLVRCTPAACVQAASFSSTYSVLPSTLLGCNAPFRGKWLC